LRSRDRALAARLLAETNGNPFFVGELLAHMGESGDLASPDSLRDVILAREGRLASTTRTLLRTAAGIGPEFSVAVLEGVQPGRGAPRCARRGQRRGADRRTRARGLRVQAPLVRRTLYRDLATARRARLHGQVPRGVRVHYYRSRNAQSQGTRACGSRFRLPGSEGRGR